MKKETFYQIGFYCLASLIIGFLTGILFSSIDKKREIPANINQIVICDTISNATIQKKAFDSLHAKNVRAELKRQGIKHVDIVLAQSILETGHYKSNVCKKNNNLFGLRCGSKYHSFSHWKQSIAYYKQHIQNRYKGGDYYKFLANIGYAEDKNYISKLKNISTNC